jgi:HPt (histidine-containing phosphotransfer) domain-containing protein
MIDCYLEDAPHYIQGIDRAIQEGDAMQLRSYAHTLKSSSATLGATTLSLLCRELETVSHTGNVDAGLDRLPQLKVEYDRVKIALQRIRQLD